MTTLFNEFAVLLALTAGIGFVATKLRQPLILAFIMVGIIAGHYGLGLISAHSEIDILASFGITLLLFIVGLKLDVDAIKAFGSVVLIIGACQIALTSVLGFALSYALGMDFIPALFAAVAMSFSSTIIIIKALSDRDDIDSLFGRIAVGVLIVQDLVVVVAIIILSSLDVKVSSANGLAWEIAILVFNGIGFLAVIAILMRTVLPIIIEQAAHSRELLVLFALAWAIILAAVADALGFGKEIGGFLAGVSLAPSLYRESIASRLDTLRNLLLVFFFINLGAALQFSTLSDDVMPALVLSAFVLLAKPLIVMSLMGYARFRKRTSFMTAITMGQVSEFSLILAVLAQNLGYIDHDVVGMIIFVSLITISISTYVSTSASEIYNKLAPYLNVFERKVNYREDEHVRNNQSHIDIIVYGFGRHGENLANILESKGFKTMGIDFDPRKIHSQHRHRMPIRYGDAEDAEFIKTLPLEQAAWVVSTIPHYDSNQILVSALRELNYKGRIAISAYNEVDIEPAKKLRVDMVFLPYRDAAMSAAEQIAASTV